MAQTTRGSPGATSDDSTSQSGIRRSDKRRFATQVAAVGAGVTLLMAIITATGLLDGLELWSVDWRFKNSFLRKPVPLDESICFVEIDGASVARHKRWPWPRSLQAEAVAEILHAGASVVAVDLLYNEPTPLDAAQDLALAHAIGSRDPDRQVVILGARLQTEDVTKVGATEADRDRLFEKLRAAEYRIAGLDLGNEQVVQERTATDSSLPLDLERFDLGDGRLLDPEIREHFLDHGVIAIRTLLRDCLPRAASAEDGELDYVAAVGNGAEWIKDIARDLEEQRKAWSSVSPVATAKQPEGVAVPDSVPIPAGVPILELAEAADAFGMTDVVDDDGALRWIEVSRPGPDGPIPTLGLAAAHHYLRLHPERAIVEDGQPATGEPGWRCDPDTGELIVGPGTGNRLQSQKFSRAEGVEPSWHVWMNWPDVGESGISSKQRMSMGAFVDRYRNRQWNLKEQAIPAIAKLWLDFDRFEPVNLTAATALHEARESQAQDVSEALTALRLAREQGGRDDPDTTHLDEARLGFWKAWHGSYKVFPDELYDLPQALRELQWFRDNARTATEKNGIDEVQQKIEAVEGEQNLKDKIVFIGLEDQTRVDELATPLGATTPGVHVHGVFADMILNGRDIRVSSRGHAILVALVLGVVISLMVAMLPLNLAAGSSVFVMLAYALGLSQAWFAWGSRMLPLAAPLTTGVLALAGALFWAHRLTEGERQRVTRHFRQRVPGDVFKLVDKHPDKITHRGETRYCTVLFIDIRGFTTISEKLGAQKTVSILNKCLGVIAETLLDHRACVNKFLGDGAMAFWSAVEVDPLQESLACKAALECQRKIVELNDTPEFYDVDEISCRIGIATGNVVVGDVGSAASLSDYTVIGDEVNLAARLESANKAFGTDIIMNGATYRAMRKQVKDSQLRTRPIGRIQVVGQRKDVGVHHLLPSDYSERQEEVTRSGVECFARGDWDEARQHFDELEEIEKEQWKQQEGDPDRFEPSGLIQVYRDEMDVGEPEKGRVIVLRGK